MWRSLHGEVEVPLVRDVLFTKRTTYYEDVITVGSDPEGKWDHRAQCGTGRAGARIGHVVDMRRTGARQGRLASLETTIIIEKPEP